jgi:hypothetical protein
VKHVDFEVVQIWYTPMSYSPYTIEKQDEYSIPYYCVKIGNNLFELGTENVGIYVPDMEIEEKK